MNAHSGWLIVGTLLFYLLSLAFHLLTHVYAAMAGWIPVMLWHPYPGPVLLRGSLVVHHFHCLCRGPDIHAPSLPGLGHWNP